MAWPALCCLGARHSGARFPARGGGLDLEPHIGSADGTGLHSGKMHPERLGIHELPRPLRNPSAKPARLCCRGVADSDVLSESLDPDRIGDCGNCRFGGPAALCRQPDLNRPETARSPPARARTGLQSKAIDPVNRLQVRTPTNAPASASRARPDGRGGNAPGRLL